jgi:conjugative transposon TraM protein
MYHMPSTPNTKKKRLLVALLIFGLPALLIVAVVLSLLHSHPANDASTSTAHGFNPHMPSPNLKQVEKNKLEVYLDAEKDSLRRQQQLHEDPYAKAASATGRPVDSPAKAAHITHRPAQLESIPTIDSNEQKVNEHLARLYAVLHNSPASPGTEGSNSAPYASQPMVNGVNSIPATLLPDKEIARLQQLEAQLHQQDSTPNPQLQQINTLLDKVLAIQHPEQLTSAPQAIKAAANKSIAYPVSTLSSNTTAPIDSADDPSINAFYGFSDESDAEVTTPAAIRAVIHADQTVQTGSVVKLRLLQDIFLKGIRIPANSFIFGPCAISNERVVIHLSQVQYQGQVYPIDMRVVDGVDGLEGIDCPGAISRDVLKEGAGQGVSSLGLTSLDPSLGAQAAAAGIETAKDFLGRKIRLITATLKAGTLAILQSGQLHQ